MSRPTPEEIRIDRAIQEVEDGLRAYGWSTGRYGQITPAQIERLLRENEGSAHKVIELVNDRLDALLRAGVPLRGRP